MVCTKGRKICVAQRKEKETLQRQENNNRAIARVGIHKGKEKSAVTPGRIKEGVLLRCWEKVSTCSHKEGKGFSEMGGEKRPTGRIPNLIVGEKEGRGSLAQKIIRSFTRESKERFSRIERREKRDPRGGTRPLVVFVVP